MTTTVAFCLATLAGAAQIGRTHCQVPCGIYGDDERFTAMSEHVTTIEKSMTQILELSQEPGANMNQIVRWVNNKEDHADKLAHIISYYFLAQRIKAPKEDTQTNRDGYHEKLELLHRISVTAMKCKQTTELKNVATLRALLAEFHDAYHTH